MWLKRAFGVQSSNLGQLGRLESELLERIWQRGETSVRDCQAELAPRLAYTTVMTTLDRLFKKGLLRRRKVGKAYFYAAAVTVQEYQARLTHHLLEMFLRDDVNQGAVLSHFVNAVSDTDAGLLERLDELVKAKRRELRRTE